MSNITYTYYLRPLTRDFARHAATLAGLPYEGGDFTPPRVTGSSSPPQFASLAGRSRFALIIVGNLAFYPRMTEATPSNPPEPRRLPPLLRRAWYSLNQTFRQKIAHLDVTPDQYSILRWLNEGDVRGLTQQTITDLMSSDPNTITSILKRMEKSGLVTRHEHETDKRARRVRIEQKGRDTFAAGVRIAKTLQTQILEALPLSRRDPFLRDLERVADACLAAHAERRE